MAQSPSHETEPKVKTVCMCVAWEIFLLRNQAFPETSITFISLHTVFHFKFIAYPHTFSMWVDLYDYTTMITKTNYNWYHQVFQHLMKISLFLKSKCNELGWKDQLNNWLEPSYLGTSKLPKCSEAEQYSHDLDQWNRRNCLD